MRVNRAMAAAMAVAAVGAGAAAAKGPSVKVRTSEAIVATWTCQDKIPEPRTHARSPWVPHNRAFRAAQLNLWTKAEADCLHRLHANDEALRRLREGIGVFYRSQGVRFGPMSGHERELFAAGRRYGLSPAFLFAASITESSGGLAPCHPNTRNVWGLASCGTWNGHGPPHFTSWAGAFDFYARFLLGRVGVSGGWPGATTTYSYTGYAKCSPCWGAATAAHMRRYFGVGPGVLFTT